jgi:hypothetical protein
MGNGAFPWLVAAIAIGAGSGAEPAPRYEGLILHNALATASAQDPLLGRYPRCPLTRKHRPWRGIALNSKWVTCLRGTSSPPPHGLCPDTRASFGGNRTGSRRHSRQIGSSNRLLFRKAKIAGLVSQGFAHFWPWGEEYQIISITIIVINTSFRNFNYFN